MLWNWEKFWEKKRSLTIIAKKGVERKNPFDGENVREGSILSINCGGKETPANQLREKTGVEKKKQREIKSGK